MTIFQCESVCVQDFGGRVCFEGFQDNCPPRAGCVVCAEPRSVPLVIDSAAHALAGLPRGIIQSDLLYKLATFRCAPT